MPENQTTTRNKPLKPVLHKKFIEDCLYQPPEKFRDWRYGFNFISKEMQAELEAGLIQCFEADLVFEPENKASCDPNREPIAVTHWYRQMAETFCQDSWWNILRENTKSDDAIEAINQLQKQHQPHALFAHHTSKSLLYVGNIVLPQLRKKQIFFYAGL